MARLVEVAAGQVEVRARLFPLYLFPPVTASTDRVAVPLVLPAGAIVDHATATISVAPAGRTPIGDVARVRPDTGESTGPATALVVDFGGMRTVSTVSAPATISQVRPWFGTSFAPAGLLGAEDGGRDVSFTEVVTERLLLTLSAAVTPAALAAGGAVTVTTAPADVEVLVAGERVHLVPGPARGPGATYGATVDITAAVAAALVSGASPLEVVLRTSVPGQLSITPQVAYLRAHRVRFPEGDSRTIVAASEGTVDVLLPIAEDAVRWHVRLLRFDLASDAGDLRVLPADGPAPTADAELVADATRPFAVRLPPTHLRRLAQLHAVRVLVAVDEPAELGGYLCTEVDGGPGEAISGGSLRPTTVDTSPSPRWVTLPLVRAVPVEPDATAWVVVQPARGSVRTPLVTPALTTGGDATVRRPAGNGTFRPLPTVAGVATGAVALRVAGVAPPTAPVPAVEVAPVGDPAAPLALTPQLTPRTCELAPDPPLTASTPGSRAGNALVLRMTVTAPAAYTLSAVTVGYEEDA